MRKMEKIIHQIWVGPYEIPDREKKYIRSIQEHHKDLEYIFWTNDNLPKLPDKVEELFKIFELQKDYAHQADILRIFLIEQYGGVYLDIDFELVNGLDYSLFNYEGLFCTHGGTDWTMPNGIFGGSRNSDIMKYLVEQIDINKGGWYGPSWLGDTVKKYLGFERETDHNLVDEKLKLLNIKYLPYQTLEREMIRHRSLYSWSPENKRNFESGNINYLD